MQPFRFAPLAVLLLACLSACDSGALPAAAPAQLSEAIPFDARIIARAAALDDSRPQAPLEASYTSADRPLYTFASQEDFERAADALSRLAKWGGEPLNIHERFHSLGTNDSFAPGSEIALLDENGQIVIGDTRMTLRVENGKPVGEVADASTGESKEIFHSAVHSMEDIKASIRAGTDGNVQARISQNAEDEFGVFPSMPNDRTIPGNPISRYDRYGQDWYIWYVYAHSAYVTWTGARRVKAATEVVMDRGVGASFGRAITADGRFDRLAVYASVLTEDHGCRLYANGSNSLGQTSVYTQIEIGGSRGKGRAVIESEHRQIDYTSNGGVFVNDNFRVYMDGEDDTIVSSQCGRIPRV